MKILKSTRFREELKQILKYIAIDNLNRAYDFKRNLSLSINKLDFMPYKCKQANSTDNPNVRDFIFKGYVVPYMIDKENDSIIILGIYKENIWQ